MNENPSDESLVAVQVDAALDDVLFEHLRLQRLAVTMTQLVTEAARLAEAGQLTIQSTSTFS